MDMTTQIRRRGTFDSDNKCFMGCGGNCLNGSTNDSGFDTDNSSSSYQSDVGGKRRKVGHSHSEQQVDSMLANALMDLKFEERRVVEEEIHGIGNSTIEETPEIIHRAMEDFEIVLQKKYALNPLHPQMYAYHISVEQKYTYITSPTNGLLRLRFLRAEFFDINKAVTRFCCHINMRLDFFGPESLQRPLRLEDLNYTNEPRTIDESSSVYKLCRAGTIQVLPGRDRANRRIIFHSFPKNMKKKIWDQAKVGFYIYTVLSEDEDVQKKGVVIIGSFPKEIGTLLLDYFNPSDTKRTVDALPVRYAAIHLCFWTVNDFTFKFAKQVLEGIGSSNFCQIRLCQGSSLLELQYKLMTFGLPVDDDSIPLTSGGVLKCKNHHAWMRTRKTIDEIIARTGSLPSMFVECPGRKDVLLSRHHKRDKRYEGNQELAKLLAHYRHSYHAAQKRSEDRDNIIREVIREITEGWGGRFLSWNEEYHLWEVLSPYSEVPLLNNGSRSSNSELVSKIRKKFLKED